MILVVSVVLGLLLRLLVGSGVRGLASTSVKHGGWLILLCIAQTFVRGADLGHGAMSVQVWCAITAVLAILVALNRAPWSGVAVVGLVMNLVVVLMNAGMPVQVPQGAVAASDGFYHAATETPRLLLLGDVVPAPFGWVVSLGDLLLFVAVTSFLVFADGEVSDDRRVVLT